MKALTGWALANQKLVILVAVLILVAGPASFLTHPSREDPEITIRTAVVTAASPGMSPRRVEDLITRKLEEEIRQMPEVENIRSTSRSGNSTLRVELYDRYTDLDPIWQDLRNRMDDVRSELPGGVHGPFVDDDYGAVAMATVALTGAGFSMAEVAETARELRRQLYSVSGLSKVELYGVEPDTIFVEFDTARLAQLGVSTQMLVTAVQQTNVVASGGRLHADGVGLTVEPTGNFESVADIGNVAIEVPDLDGQLVYLKDLATIRREYADPPEHPILVNGEPAVVLGIQMVEQFDANAFGRALRQRVVDLEHALPIGYRMQFVTFQPDEVDKAIGNVMSSLYQTVVIVLLVVMAFLGWRTGLIVGVMVPLTMLMTLLVMRLTGIELERMSLATLIIALGLLVDNGIVVSEEIGRRLAIGEERMAAALEAGRALAVPLLASSLTTVVAFLPLMLADNEAGEYTRSLSLVIAIALIGSWVLAMTVTPLACALTMKVSEPVDADSLYATPVYERYKRTLQAALRFRWLFLAGTAALLLAAVWAMQLVPKSFFPASDRAQFQVYVDLPVGSNTYATSEVAGRLSRWLSDQEANPDIESHVAYVAHGGPRFYLGLNPIDPDPHRAFVIVNTVSHLDVPTVMARVRAYGNDHLPEARVTVKPMSMGATEAGLVEYRVVGREADELKRIAAEITASLREIPGAINIRDDWENRIVKIVPQIQQAEARRAGVTTETIAQALNATLSGYPVTEFREGDQLIPVYFRASTDDRRKLDVDHLGPVVPRHVDLGGRTAAPGLLDDAVQNLRHPRRVAHLLLVADHLLEQLHLRDFLKPALPDRLVRGLRRHQQERRVVPVGGLDRGHEIGDAGAVLRDRHRHLAGGARVAVGAHAGIALMRAVPELDAGGREQVRDRHHRRADNSKCMLDPMHLQNLHERLFRRHLHSMSPLSLDFAGGLGNVRTLTTRCPAKRTGHEHIVAWPPHVNPARFERAQVRLRHSA